MILGHGIDIVDSRRIEKAYKKFGNRFVNKVISDRELADFPKNSNDIIHFLAKRWAVKEAVSKAIGCGLINGSPLHFKDIILCHNYIHMPSIEVTDKLMHIVNMMYDFNYMDLDEFKKNISFYVSTTDDAGMNFASVILEKVIS